MASPRRVAVALVLSFPLPSSSSSSLQEPTFLLVSSRKKDNRYVFPKGGVEQGESPAFAACREAWEEAGLVQGSAAHLTHLLTLHDPSPHILSPSSDPASPSFVPSCEYSFELFVLPVPVSLSPSPSPSTTPSSTSTSTSTSTSDSLPETWPESHERHRKLVHGWKAVEEITAWGRRDGVMREAIGKARVWVEEWQKREGRVVDAHGRVEEEEDEDEEEEEDTGDGDDGEAEKGRL